MTDERIEEPLVPELPDLADDGTVGLDQDPNPGFDLDVSDGDASELDDSLVDDDLFDAGFDEEEPSFLGDDAADLDIGDDDAIRELDEGFLDDSPANALDVGFENLPESSPPNGSDVGQEGLDEPALPRPADEDATDLPPLDRSGSDEADDLDVGVTLILPI